MWISADIVIQVCIFSGLYGNCQDNTRNCEYTGVGIVQEGGQESQSPITEGGGGGLSLVRVVSMTFFQIILVLSGVVCYTIHMRILNNISVADMLRLIVLAYIALC